MSEPTTPILVGCAQYVRRAADLKGAPSPQEMMAEAAAGALGDARAEGLAQHIDTVAAIRTFADSAPQYASPFGGTDNYPAAVAKRIGARPRRQLYPFVGGNTPQMMVNLLAEDIRTGRSAMALVAGAEALRTAAQAAKEGVQLDWNEPYDDAPETPGDPRAGVSGHELRHGLGAPAATYPLFETALAAHYGRGMAAHRLYIGELFARFSEVAAKNPYAAVPVARTAAEIAAPSEDNRIIAWPYTKYMNANLYVDQAAAVLLTSVGKAQELGIPRDKWIFLTGSADISEKWFVTERVNYHSCPAIAVGARHALSQAGVAVEDLSFFDIYSCFPSAVEVAVDALGLLPDDPRGFTVTGGLPYFGGPGNNYSLHAIAEMMGRLRGKPGAHGLVTANGWYLTKHSFGVYSSEPPQEPWRHVDPAGYQAQMDRLEAPAFTEQAEGSGRIETCTVVFSRLVPERGIVIGRLDATGERFLANTPKGDRKALDALMEDGAIGRPIAVTHEKGLNTVQLL